MPTTNPVPSTDPSDLLFNAGRLDEVVNGTANSFTDRLGVQRRTVAGMNADFDAQLADAESDLNVYRADAASSAAEALGYLQTIRATSYGAYASDPATDPLGNPPTVGDEYFNTTSNLLKRWNGTTWQASDINTANLAASSGSSLVGYDGGTVQDALDAVTGPTGAASVGYTPAGAGAVVTTVEKKLQDTVSVKDFGAKGDWNGTTGTDDTAAIQAAKTYAEANGKELKFPDGKYLVNAFGVTMDQGTLCAFRVSGSLSIVGPGIIVSTTSAVNNSIFGIDATSGTVSLSINGVGFAGNARYRAIYAESSATIDTTNIRNINTSRQSIILNGTVIRSILVSDNKIGNAIDASTAVSPTLTVILPQEPANNPECAIERNVVRTGTEASSTGAFVIHGLPMGARCNYNTHINIGGAATEGFDIDNVGRFSQINGNSTYGSGFEYKVGTGGYSDSRDIIFSNNITINGGFSFRSSCIGYGNIAFNPVGYGLFCTPGSDVDGLLDDATFQLHGFRIIYAGSTPWTAAVKVDGGMAGMEFDGIRIELDPAWRAANPTGSLPGIQFNIDGDINNLTIRNCFIDKSAGDQINVRPTTRISNLNIENVQFGDCGDSCIDLLNCDAVRIINPVFPATITDRPVRLTTCDRVRIECDYHASITLAQASGANTGVLINNYGTEAAGAATPPNTTNRWPVGCVVLNTSDNSVWLRISGSTTPASAWKQIA